MGGVALTSEIYEPIAMADGGETSSGQETRGRRKDLKVAIVGGGMCGLACAVGLKNAGVEVDIYEAAVSIFIDYLQAFI